MKKQKKIPFAILWICLLMLNTNLIAQDPNFHIYLCFGQSNMEGMGPIQAADMTVDSRFKVFQALNCPNLSRTKQTWYTAKPPLCQCYTYLSPADYFGVAMVDNLPDSITVGVINVSVSGCDIRLFDKDIYMNYDSTYVASWFLDKVVAYGGNPYQYLINLAQLAQQDGVIKGILLHQGETNTGQAAWPTYVNKIYTDMLADLSLTAGSVPLLAGQVLSASGSCCSSMNPVINTLPNVIPTAHVISSSGCTGLADHAHFDSEGNRKLGRRYAMQMLSLLGYKASYAETECGTIGQNWEVLSDNTASNSTYVTAKTGLANGTVTPPSDIENMISMDITLSDDTTYYIYGRFNNATTSSDAFWVKIDGNAFELFDNLTTTGWQWIELKNLHLTAGTHSITVASAEEGAKFDKLEIKNSEHLALTIGEEAANLCVPTVSGIMDPSAMQGYALNQNYPNPISGNTVNISFEVPTATYVSLKIYNSKGVEVNELTGQVYGAGEHVIQFNNEKLSPGIYYYTMKTDKFTASRKMIVPGK